MSQKDLFHEELARKKAELDQGLVGIFLIMLIGFPALTLIGKFILSLLRLPVIWW